MGSCGMQRYQCRQCPGSTRTLTELKCHLRTHSATSCRHCQRRFGHRHFLLRHVRLRLCRRGRSQTLRTPISEQRRRSSTEQHVQALGAQQVKEVIGGPDRPACPKCKSSFAGQDSLSHHLRSSKRCGLRSKAYACPKCEQSFPKASVLAKHKSGKGCAVRLRRLELEAALAKAAHSTDSSTCPKCLKTFARQDNMMRHLRSSQRCGSSKEAFVCPKCGLGVPQAYLMAKHIRGVGCATRQRRLGLEAALASAGLPPDSATCPRCARRYKTQASMLNHLAVSRHCGSRGSVFACDECGKDFTAPQHLANHMKTGIACRLRLKQEALLKKVAKVEVEAGVKREKAQQSCDGCSATFRKAGHLARHFARGSCQGDKAPRDQRPKGAKPKHKLTSTAKETELKSAPCYRCGRRFLTEAGLFIHWSMCRSKKQRHKSMPEP